MDLGVLYTNLRNYIEESVSLQKEQLAEQKRTNELLNEIRLAANRADDRLKGLAREEVIATVGEVLAEPPVATKKGK